jgi:DNA-binding transcriptional LysR family regulator
LKLTLAQLEALFWVARLGSVRAAAARLSLTQPALSLRIKELEAAVGGRLLNRDSYRATLTTLGVEVSQQAQRMLDLAGRIGERDPAGDDIRGLIRMGATDTYATRYLPALLVDIETRFPRANVELVVEYSVNLYQKLLAGELDVAVISGPTLSPLLSFERLLDLPHYWVGSPRRLGTMKQATPAALAKIPIFTHPAPSLLYETIQAWFASANLVPLHLSTCTSLYISKALTVEGVGVSLLPKEIIEPEIQRGALRVLRARPAIPRFPMFVAYRRDAPPARLRRFVERIRASVLARQGRRARTAPPST